MQAPKRENFKVVIYLEINNILHALDFRLFLLFLSSFVLRQVVILIKQCRLSDVFTLLSAYFHVDVFHNLGFQLLYLSFQ